jgi:ankyrin repeat protein
MRDKYGQTPMHIAAGKGNSEIVELLVDERGDKEAQDNNGQTPLHVAAKSGKIEAVRVLVRKGANKRAKDADDRTPLHLALDCATALILLDSNVSTVSSV